MSRLVKGRREDTFVYYSAEDDHVRRLLTQALYHANHLDRDPPAVNRRPTPQPGSADSNNPAVSRPCGR